MRRFGSLPRAGGVFDQPAHLMEELRIVHDAFNDEQAKRAKREQRAAGKTGGKRRARRRR